MKNQEFKICKSCKKIITDPNNKTGICDSCKRRGITIATIPAAIIGGIVLKKGGPLLLKGSKKVIEKGLNILRIVK